MTSLQEMSSLSFLSVYLISSAKQGIIESNNHANTKIAGKTYQGKRYLDILLSLFEQ